jgi:hypothetical protein
LGRESLPQWLIEHRYFQKVVLEVAFDSPEDIGTWIGVPLRENHQNGRLAIAINGRALEKDFMPTIIRSFSRQGTPAFVKGPGPLRLRIPLHH